MRYRCLGATLVAGLGAAFLSACGSTSPNPNTPSCTFRVALQNSSFGPSGGPGTATVSAASGCAWTASSSNDWIAIAAPAAGRGDGRVSFTVAPYDGAGDRSGAIVVAKETLAIGQQGQPPGPGAPSCTFTVSQVQFYPHSYGGTAAFTVTTAPGCAWSVTTPAPWIHLKTGGGSGSGSVAMTFDPNPEGYVTDFRKGVVEVRWPTVTAGQNVQIWQYGNCNTAFFPAPGATFSAADTLSFGADGGDAHVFVLVEAPIFGCPWVVESQAAAPFNVVFPAIQAIQKGDGDLHISAPPNPSSQPRTATIVAGERPLKIVQAGR